MLGPSPEVLAKHARSCAGSRPWQQLQSLLPWTQAARNKMLATSLVQLWDRHSSDDLLYILLLLINASVVKARGPLLLPAFRLPAHTTKLSLKAQ